MNSHNAALPRNEPRLALLLQAPPAERTNLLTAVLDGPSGDQFRQEASRRIADALSVERLVPEAYAEWRPLVYDAMVYFGSHLSTARLAPKLVEQLELPSSTTPERRLLKLIAKVPGLQKLGQVIARNRHLHPGLRRELTRLENGISDVTVEEILSIIDRGLGPQLKRYEVDIERKIFAEASVSAVLRFTWRNPKTQRREHGVFKVMKPYIPDCFAEDMHLLAELAAHLGSRHKKYGFAERVLPDTFNDVRRLLQHEVGFVREQASLRKAAGVHYKLSSVRIPEVIRPLCTRNITALTEEHGEKITSAVARLPKQRRRHVARQLIDTLIAVPLLTPGSNGIFHADPHAGNLLYDKRSGTLTLLDWALTARVTEEQRRQFGMLFLMVLLRDPEGVIKVIEDLSLRPRKPLADQHQAVRREVARFFNEQPLTRIPRGVDIMRLLERITWQGVRLPTGLVMLRKILFTLDGILHEIAGAGTDMEAVLVQRLLTTWLQDPGRLGWPLSTTDWATVQWSAMLYGSRVVRRSLQQLAATARSRASQTASATSAVAAL